jgi:hypothetical protein
MRLLPRATLRSDSEHLLSMLLLKDELKLGRISSLFSNVLLHVINSLHYARQRVGKMSGSWVEGYPPE